MSSTTQLAKSAIKLALDRLDGAVKTRQCDRDDEYWIEGDREELFVRAGLMPAQPHQSAADSSAEIASLRAENGDLRAKLTEANAKNERLRAENADLRAKLADANDRLKNALHEKVVEEIAAKLAAKGETKPTVDDVVTAARGRAFKIERAEPTAFAEKKIA
jgi:regulator of replication initiation timing